MLHDFYLEHRYFVILDFKCTVIESAIIVRLIPLAIEQFIESLHFFSYRDTVFRSIIDKFQDIGYPDVSRHRLPETSFFLHQDIGVLVSI